MIRITITEEALRDLADGYSFYEIQEPGAGEYFASCLKGDIAGLRITAGIHRKAKGYHRLLSRVFPYAIYYRFAEESVAIVAVIDCRRDPQWIRSRLE